MDKTVQAGREIYINIVQKKITIITVLIFVILFSLVINIFVGSAGLTLGQTVAAIIRQADDTSILVVWDIRMPVALSAVFIGAALGMAGCEMQTILRNPMASAYTLGLSSAASFGAALAIVLRFSVIPGIGNYMLIANSLLFTMLAAGVIIAFSKKSGADRGIIILFGIALNFLFGSLTTLIKYVANEVDLQSFVFWSFGSLTKMSWEKLAVTVFVTVLCFIIFARKAWKLTAMSLSDTNALSLGIDVNQVRRNTIFFVALLAATTVSFAGTIGFVGLVAPHLARMISGEDQRYFLPLSALIGALILSLASILCKILVPGTILPIGLITSIIGIPFFAALILQRKRSYM